MLVLVAGSKARRVGVANCSNAGQRGMKYAPAASVKHDLKKLIFAKKAHLLIDDTAGLDELS